MMTIKTIDGYDVKVDDDCRDDILSLRWTTCYVKGYRYAQITLKDKTYMMARMITNCPKGKLVDHINHDTLDNRLINLRICDKSQNGLNRVLHKNNTSGFPGVYPGRRSGSWCARIMIRGKAIFLGTFNDFDLACGARRVAEIKYSEGFHPISDNRRAEQKGRDK